MNRMGRRRFLTLTGAGIVAVAVGGIALARRQFSEQANTLTFQAITGLPAKPLLSYASYVISGKMTRSNGTGTITKYVYAGPPESMSSIPLYIRTLHVTGVNQQSSVWHITATVDTQMHLQKGEDAVLEVLLDSSQGIAQSTFFGSSTRMYLQHFAIS